MKQEDISQMKHQLDATLCRSYFCRVTLHVSDASAHHQEYLKLVRRPLVHVLSLQVSHHISLLGPNLGPNKEKWRLVLNTPDDERLRPKHVEWLCRNKTCTVLHQVGVSFDLYIEYLWQFCAVSSCHSHEAGSVDLKLIGASVSVCRLILRSGARHLLCVAWWRPAAPSNQTHTILNDDRQLTED